MLARLPFGLIAGLATGDYYTSGYEVVLYAPPFLVLMVLVFTISRRLLSAKN